MQLITISLFPYLTSIQVHFPTSGWYTENAHLSLNRKQSIRSQSTFPEQVFLKHRIFHLHLLGTLFPMKINGYYKHANGGP